MIIPYSVNNGAWNMAQDEKILETAIKEQEQGYILRFYGWSPSCVSLGRNQNDDFIDKDFLRSQNIDIIRRITGGRALLHKDELTYCFVCSEKYLKNGQHIISSYKEISQFLIDGMKELGINLDYGEKKQTKFAKDYCMMLSTGADLCYEGKKLIGSAQCRRNGYILQHGSILLDYEEELLNKIFRNSNNSAHITSVKLLNPQISLEQIIEVMTTKAQNLFQ